MSIHSRRVVGDDRLFLLDLYAAGRVDEFSAVGWIPAAVRAFLDQQYQAREAGWAVSAPAADDLLLVRDDRPLGRLVLDRRADNIRVVDVALMPEAQGQGIGTAVLREVLAEADAVGVPVTLHVVATSPARGLYERLGFRPVEEEPPGDAVHVPMVRVPEPGGAQPNTAM